MIDKSTIDKIFEVARIDEVIGEFVQLKKRGVNLIGLCPFHNEKTPSFTVNITKGIYKCFGCGKGGNVVNFIMEHEKLSYPEALRFLAHKYNIEITESHPDPKEYEQKQNLREQLYHIHQIAKNYFIQQLHETDEGKSIGLSYLTLRGLSPSAIRTFELGYSPSDKTALTRFLLKNHFEKSLLIESGLCIETSHGLTDRFHDRIIFPIHNLTGRVIGFGGRTLKKEDKAKYINSPETLIYEKGKNLYGLYFSKSAIIKENYAILVEGYMDLISLADKGVHHVIAGSGTAFTQEQLKLIRRFTQHVLLFYDGDEAGISAAEKAALTLLQEGFYVEILPLPPEDDPDSFIKNKTTEEILEYLRTHRKDYILHLIDLIPSAHSLSPYEKTQWIEKLAHPISRLPNLIMRNDYIKKLSSALQVEEGLLSIQIAQTSLAQKTAKEIPPTSPASPPPQNSVSNLIREAEYEYLRLLVTYGDENLTISYTDDEGVKQSYEIKINDQLIHEIKVDQLRFSDSTFQKVYDEYEKLHASYPDTLIQPLLLRHEDQEIVSFCSQILQTSYSISEKWKEHHIEVYQQDQHLERAILHAIKTFKITKLSEKIQQHHLQLQNPHLPEEETLTLLLNIQSLERKKNAIAKALGWTVIK